MMKKKMNAEIAVAPFYFFIDVGHYTGLAAVSLPDFYAKVKRVDSRSLQFHLHRRDFQTWIMDFWQLTELVQDLDLITKKKLVGERLRQQLLNVVAFHL